MIPVKSVVKKYAMGSLLPLSSSSIGLMPSRRLMLLERRIENTAAASVEEIIAPSNKASIRVKSSK